jgi:hypothetical protein
MMQCFVCHLTQLEPIDAYAKHKGLMNYNKKHACHEHPNLYKKWGLFLLQKVAETQSENKGQRRGNLSPLLKSQIFLATNGLTINQIR